MKLTPLQQQVIQLNKNIPLNTAYLKTISSICPELEPVTIAVGFDKDDSEV